MSGNYVYTPPTYNAPIDYRNSPYLGPFYAQSHSPFIPPMPLNASPFASPFISPAAAAVPLPPSPNPGHSTLPPAFTPYVPFPNSADPGPYSPYVPAWQRERRLSWNEPPETETPWGYTPRPPTRQRTRSFHEYPNQMYLSPPTAPGYNPYVSNAPPAPPGQPPILHPYIYGSVPRGDIIFDLAGPQFSPARYVANNQVWPLQIDELNQNATNPQTYKLTISSDYWIPEWPLNLDFRTTDQFHQHNVPPLKLGDVLSAIYATLQKRISQHDWSRLDQQHEYFVSQAYTRRCKAAGPGELATRNKGVKQLDFLLGKTRFRGLVPVGDSIEHFKLLVD